MSPGGAREPQSYDRRQRRRIKLAVPVRVCRVTAEQGAPSSYYTGLSTDLSPGGVYVTTREGECVVPGEVLTVSIAIPWEARRAFPFSHIMGSSRVIRVEPIETAEGNQTGLALAFCGDDVTFLGAVVTPR